MPFAHHYLVSGSLSINEPSHPARRRFHYAAVRDGLGRGCALDRRTRIPRPCRSTRRRGPLEFFYVVADERDLLSLRTNHRDERVQLYRMIASKEGARSLLDDFRQERHCNRQPNRINGDAA